MRSSFTSIAFLLSVAACGGSSQRTDEDAGRNGGTSGLGGGGATTGGASVTGGTGAGGSGATGYGPLSGDYWVGVDPGFFFYVTVTSETKALVGAQFEPASEYDILHTPGAPPTEAGGYPPDTELTGEFVLRRADGDPNAIDFVIETDADVSSARIGRRSQPCGGAETYQVQMATATRDNDPPAWRVTPEWGIAPPWSSFSVEARRPVLAPLSAGFRVALQSAPVGVVWADSEDWFSTAAGGSLDDWVSYVGLSLELSGGLHGTNGLNSEVLASIDVPDFGMHEGPVTFESAETDVALWGGAIHQPAGVLADCPDGCVTLTNKANAGMRFIRPGASLRVTAIFNDISIDFMAADGTSATVSTPDMFGGVVSLDIPIPFETDDLFVVFRGPSPIVAGGCPTPANLAYLVAVEPEGVP